MQSHAAKDAASGAAPEKKTSPFESSERAIILVTQFLDTRSLVKLTECSTKFGKFCERDEVWRGPFTRRFPDKASELRQALRDTPEFRGIRITLPPVKELYLDAHNREVTAIREATLWRRKEMEAQARRPHGQQQQQSQQSQGSGFFGSWGPGWNWGSR